MMNEHKTRLFTIKNMDCADCALKIEKAVSRLPGVKLAEVSFATSKLKVVSETPQFDDQVIIKTIKDLGYSTEAEELSNTVTLLIEGMDCPDESEIIKKKMKSLTGINNFEIYLISGQLKVSYEPSLISVQDIIKAIAETGMKAVLTKEKKGKAKAWWKEKRILFLFACGFLTVLGFLLGKFGVAERITHINWNLWTFSP